MRPYKYGPADKYGPYVALTMLASCVAFYFFTGFNKAYGNFPVQQVLYALPVAFLVWGLAAIVDDPAPGYEQKWAENGQCNYRTVSGFISNMIFGTVIFTAIFITFGIGK